MSIHTPSVHIVLIRTHAHTHTRVVPIVLVAVCADIVISTNNERSIIM